MAIQAGLSVATRRPEAQSIYVFSDLHSAIWKVTNVFRHSGQGISLEICRDQLWWLDADGGCCVTFVYTPSCMCWKVQGSVHECAKALSVPVGMRCRTSVNAV